MLSRFALTILVAALTLSPATLHGQTAGADGTHPQQEKIGKVNIQEVIASSKAGKKALGEIEKQFEPKKNELAKQNAEISDLKRQLSDQKSTLSDKDRNKLASTIASKEKILRSNYEQTQKELQKVETDMVTELGTKVLHVVEHYAKNNGYAAILDTSGPTVDVLWASASAMRQLGLPGKSESEVLAGLRAAFASKEAPIINQELINACDAELH